MPGEDNNWLDDDEWERNWNEQVSGTKSSTSAPSTKSVSAASKPAGAANHSDFEQYNPLSSVKSKSASSKADDDLWDLLNK